MANARGQAIDKTHLSSDQANIRGIIHRDLIAHCMRWSHVAKFIREKNRYKNAVVLDIGCGVDLPLARTLHTNRMTPQLYVGVDYNKTEKLNAYNHNFGDKPFYFHGSVAFPEGVTADEEGLSVGEDHYRFVPNIITCFEVLEHVEPAHARMMVRRMREIAALHEDGCDLFISTPNWDPKVGAADNHVNEMKYGAVGYLLESEGLAIENVYGTFASQKDYKITDFEVGDCDREPLKMLWEALGDYYDSNYLSTIFAPLFPDKARNALWHCHVAEEPRACAFEKPSTDEPFTSSEKWMELLL